jgi:pimeloyl-ACP methyl ester carboxylesterase
MNIAQWRSIGDFYTILGRQIFVIDKGSATDTLVILHGYPTSSFDYWMVLEKLSEKYRVIIHDHLGFGLSDKPLDYSYSLVEQAEIALGLWKKLTLTEVTILAHDYGTSVATEILARSQNSSIPIKIKELVLCNGSIHIELSQLRLIQKLLKNKTLGPIVAKFASEQTFVRNMKNIWYDKSTINIEKFKEMWQLLISDNGRKVLPKITQYINERFTYWHRWIGALKQTELPVHIIWATEDPVAIKAIGLKLHEEIPNSELHLLEKTGHYPMLEKPTEWSDLVLRALKN